MTTETETPNPKDIVALAELVKVARELFLKLLDGPPHRRARWRRVTGPDGYTRLMGQRAYRAHLRAQMPLRSKAIDRSRRP